MSSIPFFRVPEIKYSYHLGFAKLHLGTLIQLQKVQGTMIQLLCPHLNPMKTQLHSCAIAKINSMVLTSHIPKIEVSLIFQIC